MEGLRTNPLGYLCERFNKAEEGKEKDSMALELLPYAYGKLRSVEHKADPDSKITVIIGSTMVTPLKGEADGEPDNE